MSDTDSELLGRYARHHAEDAFAELVRRHLGLVYSAALRQVRSPQLAEEVTQSVFIDLARSAAKLKLDTILTAWLYQVTRRTAIDVVRREASRQIREQVATEMNATAADWAHIEPLLDEAMHALNDVDRTAVLLRYFENKSLREVGATLGTSDDAARKRVNRAVECLREFFAKNGVTIGGSGLVVAISTNAVQAAPVGLLATISGVVTAGTVLAATVASKTALTTMNWINSKSVAALVASALVAGTATYLTQESESTRLRAENGGLAARQASLTRERDTALSAATASSTELERLRNDKNELLRLRGEVAQLRRQVSSQKAEVIAIPAASIGSPASAGHSPGSFISKDELANAGFATPEAALETLWWAGTKGTYEQIIECFSPERLAEELKDPNHREKIEAGKKADMPFFKGMQIVAKKVLREHEVELQYQLDFFAGAFGKTEPNVGELMVQSMIKIGDQWKFGSDSRVGTTKWDDDPQVQKFVP